MAMATVARYEVLGVFEMENYIGADHRSAEDELNRQRLLGISHSSLHSLQFFYPYVPQHLVRFGKQYLILQQDWFAVKITHYKSDALIPRTCFSWTRSLPHNTYRVVPTPIITISS